MEFMGITFVAAISVICCLLATLLKATALPNKWLPSLCGVLGALLGALCYYTVSDFPAHDLVSAVAIGIVSGLAATGGYEAVHQLKKGRCEEETK